MQKLPAIQRVITGHRADGTAVITASGPLPKVVEFERIPGTLFHEVWSTATTPVVIDNGSDPVTGPVVLPPPAGGTRIRFVDIPPDTEEFLQSGAAGMSDAFGSIGHRKASTAHADSPHPLMHRTETVDYGVVIAGEIVLLVDDGEVTLRQGAVVIQRGTNHAWANRTDKVCRMLFVLVSGTYAPELAAALQARG